MSGLESLRAKRLKVEAIFEFASSVPAFFNLLAKETVPIDEEPSILVQEFLGDSAVWFLTLELSEHSLNESHTNACVLELGKYTHASKLGFLTPLTESHPDNLSLLFGKQENRL